VAQTGILPLPPNYKTTFENADFLVMKVHYGAHELVPMHDHSAYPTLYVYLNDSGEVQLKHEGPQGFVAVRPPTHTGAFRISPGMAERHSVQSLSDTPSDFLRVEMKRIPVDDLKKVSRGEAPAEPTAPGTKTEFQDPALRVERTMCPAAATCELPKSTDRSLLVAVKATHVRVGSEDHALQAGDTVWLSGVESKPVVLGAGAQCLRVSLLYR
jgi:hypothetical protein